MGETEEFWLSVKNNWKGGTTIIGSSDERVCGIWQAIRQTAIGISNSELGDWNPETDGGESQ